MPPPQRLLPSLAVPLALLLALFLSLAASPALAHDAPDKAPPSEAVRRAEEAELRRINDRLTRPAAAGAARAAQASAATRLAERRRELVARLARWDPVAAAQLVLPAAARDALPGAARDQVEARTTVEGRLQITHADFDDDHGAYRVAVVGPRGPTTVILAVPLDGASGGDLVRASGAVLPGDGTLLADHLVVVGRDAANDLTALGPQRTAVILASAPGAGTHPYATKLNTASLVFSPTSGVSLRAFVDAASYGQTTVVGGGLTRAAALAGTIADVHGPYELSSTVLGATCDFDDVVELAFAAADPDVNYGFYDRVIVAWNNPGCGSGGVATVGTSSWSTDEGTQYLSVSLDNNAALGSTNLNGLIGGVALHEYGHNLGLQHANTLRCGSVSIGGAACGSTEYGDPADAMGGSSGYGQYSGFQKDRLGWLTLGRLQTVSSSGTYTLAPYEATDTSVKTLRVPRTRNAVGTVTSYYYLEYRQPTATWGQFARTYPAFGSGVTVRTSAGLAECSGYCAPDYTGPGGGGATVVVDTHPGSFANRRDYEDSPLEAGQSYADSSAGLTLQVTSTSSTGATVLVTVGTPLKTIQANVYPTGAGTVSGGGTVTAGQSVTLTATAAAGYAFVRWRESRANQSYANPYTFTASGDRYLEAVFAATTAPANDGFASSTTVSSLPAEDTVDNSAATSQSGEPTSTSCGTTSRTVWYSYTPAASGSLTVSTAGSTTDTMVATFTGSSVGVLAEVACAEQYGKSDQAQLSFPVTAGTTYRIQVGTYPWSNDEPGGTLSVAFSAPTPPANDAFASATALTSLPQSLAVDTSGATMESGEPTTGCGTMASSVWYSYRPSTAGALRITTGDSSYYTITRVFTGSSLGGLSQHWCWSSSNNGSPGGRMVTRLAADTTYYIQVGGYSGSAFYPGSGSLALHFEAENAPANDAFANASSLSPPSSVTYQSIAAASTETGETTSPSCGSTSRTLWYRYAPSSSGTLTISTADSNFPATVAVYTGSALGSLTEVTCAHGTLASYPATASFTASAGTTYYVQVGGFSGYYGDLSIAFMPAGATPLTNDAFASASPAASLPAQFLTSTSSATTETGERTSTSCGTTGKTVWYSYTPSSDTLLAVSTAGSDFYGLAAAYVGGSIGGLVPIACNAFGEGYQSRLIFKALAGTTYHLQVGGYGGASGNLAVTLTALTAPPNDAFGSATTVSSFPAQLTTSTFGATAEGGEPLITSCASVNKSVWYRLAPSSSGSITADTRGSSFDTVLGVYTGSAVAALTPVACGDDTGGTLASTAAFNVTAGGSYYVQVAGYAGANGSVVLNLAQSSGTVTPTPTPAPTSTPGPGTPTATATPASNAQSVPLLMRNAPGGW